MLLVLVFRLKSEVMAFSVFNVYCLTLCELPQGTLLISQPADVLKEELNRLLHDVEP